MVNGDVHIFKWRENIKIKMINAIILAHFHSTYVVSFIIVLMIEMLKLVLLYHVVYENCVCLIGGLIKKIFHFIIHNTT